MSTTLRTLPALLLIAVASSGALAQEPPTDVDPGSVENVAPEPAVPPVDGDAVDGGGLFDGDPVVDDGGIVDADGDGMDDGSVDDGSVQDGYDGYVDDGTDGSGDEGYADDGSIDDGSVIDDSEIVDDGTVDDGYIDEDGSVDDGAIDDGAIDGEYADDGSMDDGAIDDGSGVDDGGIGDDGVPGEPVEGGGVIGIGDDGVYGGNVIKLEDGSLILRGATDTPGSEIYTYSVSPDPVPGAEQVPVDSMFDAGPSAASGSEATAPPVSLDLPDALGAAQYAPSAHSMQLDATDSLGVIDETIEAPPASEGAPATPAPVRIRDGHLVNTKD